VQVNVRFLHLMARLIGELREPASRLLSPDVTGSRFVDSLQVGDRLLQSWQEAIERDCIVGPKALPALIDRSLRSQFTFAASRQVEPVRDNAGMIVAVLVREQQSIRATVEVGSIRVADGLFKLRVRIENETAQPGADQLDRDDAMLRSLVSTHTVLGVCDGEFLSLIDPPDGCRELAASCANLGAWPILVGDVGATDTMLSSPITLYDYPQIAPESPGDLFDSTEIDEILTLRILTLTEDEKRMAAAVDERARTLLSRTESLAQNQLLGLHGTVRGLRPVGAEAHR
jgi:hypothetical protein